MLGRKFISAPGYDHIESLFGGRGGESFEGLIINYVKVPQGTYKVG